MMIKTIRVMLVPNNKQKTKLFQYANTARFAYNWALGREQENYKNGGKFILEGTERDFPLTLHRTAYTGTDKETHDVEIPLTEGAELPRVKFHYGTVEFLSAAQEDTIYDNPYDEIEEPKEATKITVRYRTLPAKGIRKMRSIWTMPMKNRNLDAFRMTAVRKKRTGF